MNMNYLQSIQGMTGDKWICTSIAAVLVLFLLVRLIAWLFRGTISRLRMERRAKKGGKYTHITRA